MGVVAGRAQGQPQPWGCDGLGTPGDTIRWWKMRIWGEGENRDEGVTAKEGNVRGGLGWAGLVPLGEDGEVPKRKP